MMLLYKEILKKSVDCSMKGRRRQMQRKGHEGREGRMRYEGHGETLPLGLCLTGSRCACYWMWKVLEKVWIVGRRA
jgi:hypothetical protein